jgi:hypothetical protein
MNRGNNSTTSRREILAMTLGGAALATIATQRADAASKISQASVTYQSSPNGDKSCKNCKLFQAPNACKSVEGSVSPSGYCKLWNKA